MLQNQWLVYTFWFAYACFVVGALTLVGMQLRQYLRLRTIDVLKKELTEGRDVGSDLSDLTIHQGDRIQHRLHGYGWKLRQNGSISDPVWSKMEGAITLHDWIDLFQVDILPSLDERARRIIEEHAQSVAICTALSPSGIIDSLLVFWRNTKMLAEVAGVYGARPGIWGTIVLGRRVGKNVATAAVTQEVIHLVHLAYGPKIAQGIGKAVEGVGGAIAYAGGATAFAIPLIGIPMAGIGAVVKTIARGTGEALEIVSGPTLDAFLTAILTIRVGQEVQRQCRIIPMTSEEEARETATLGSAMRQLFTAFLGKEEEFDGIAEESSPVPAIA